MKSNVQYKTKRTMGNRVLAYVYMLNGSEKKNGNSNAKRERMNEPNGMKWMRKRKYICSKKKKSYRNERMCILQHIR